MNPISLRLLPQRATVKRFNSLTGEIDTTVYTNLPCRIGRKTNYPNNAQVEKSSVTQGSILICNHEFNNIVVSIRMEDLITVDFKVYRVIGSADAASASHHLEVDVQFLETMAQNP